MTTKVTSGKYVRVGSKKGPLVIGGALAKMEQDPSFIYVPMYMVAGPKDEVTEWLQENYPDTVKEALKTCYSKTTLKSSSVREAFENEVEAASKERKEVSVTRAEMRQVNLMVLVKLLQMYDNEKRTGEVSERTEPPEPKKSSSRSMKDKVSEISEEDKVLDVTTMKAKGTEGKKISMKSGSLKKRLSQIKSDPLYHVVYNSSAKSAASGVKNFLVNYGSFTKDQIETVVTAVKEGNIINLNKGKSPTRSPVMSPKRRQKKKVDVSGGDGNDLDNLLNSLPVN
jgi:hypothetical protein